MIAAPPPPPLVVYASERTGVSQVYAVRSDGRGLRQLTFGSTNACDPHPAAPGTIGYSTGSGFCGGGVTVGTLRGRVLTAQVGFHPSWSRDGTLAYVDDQQNLVVEGRVVHTDAWEPAWSSRGRLAFYAWRDDAVMVMRRGSPAVVDRRSGAAGLTWSPDGARLAYRFSDFTPSRVGIAVDGRAIFAVASGDIVGPTWSPDARKLAFAIGGKLDVVDLQGHVRAIAELPVTPTAVAWSPRGDVIAAVDSAGVETVRLDGTVRRIVRDPDTTSTTLFWLQPPPDTTLLPPQPPPLLVRSSVDELQTRDQIGGVVAAGGTAAFALCRGVHTWTPGVDATPPSELACGDESWWRVSWSPDTYALADGLSVTLQGEGGNHFFWQLVVRHGGTTTVALEGDDQYRGDPTIPTVRHLLGGGDSVVFSRFARCGGAGCGDALDPSGHNPNLVASTSIYRIGPDGVPVVIASAPGAYEPFAFDGSHIVVRRHLTGVDLLAADGSRFASFELGRTMVGAALDGEDAYALGDGGLLFEVDLAGNLVRTLQLPGDATLGGAAGGTIGFVSGGTAYVETVSTTRVCALGAATSMALTGAGAFVGRSATGAWQSSIRFVPFSGLRC